MVFEECKILKVLAKNLECCICLKIFLDPVTSFCGRHNYCEKCLTTHLGRNAEKRCPECRESLRSDYRPQRYVTLCKIVDDLGRQTWQDILSHNELSVIKDGWVKVCRGGKFWSRNYKSRLRFCFNQPVECFVLSEPELSTSERQETKLDVPVESVPPASMVQDIKSTLDPTGSTFPVYREQPEGFEWLTFSPLLGHGDLALSEDNRRAEVQHRKRVYHQERFSSCQVMAEQEFTSGTHYWHVDPTNSVGWAIGVAYSSLGRDDRLGRTAASWCLEWTSRRLSYWHNNTKEHLDHARPSSITVSLDMDNGQLSFYSRDDNGTVLLHSMLVHFQEPVRPAFWLYGLQRGNSLAFTGP